MKLLEKNVVKIYNKKIQHDDSYFLTPNEMQQQRKIKMYTYKEKKTVAKLILQLFNNFTFFVL